MDLLLVLPADAMCNFKKTNYVARYDNGRKRWMCFSPDDISIEGQSFCSDNCGGPVQCAGGVTEGEIPAYTVYIIQHPDIAEAFAALHPCKHPDEICVPSSVNPPKCVKSRPPASVHRLSDQQRALDSYCQTLTDQLCREGKQTKNCYELWVARRDASQEGEPPAWACYPASFLDLSDMSTCLDGCSNQVPCAGAPKSFPDFCVMQPELKAIAENPNFCSPFQRAANEYCKKKQGAASVARRHTKSDDWACFPADELPPPGWTGCADNCGNFSFCTGSLAEVVSAATAPGVQPDPGVATAVKSVPAPCLEGEECTATGLNPLYCSHTRPNPQPKPLPNAVLREALGCGGMQQ
ncbi:microneme protein [Cystoisospora suis]|uniref:Microneme protein n=1 Tax=Cystoisospora suis TaxID=483139 RepID=A0A2C6L209_9APIC|nr:microneme protein [Cystoisospora suis]